MKVKLEDVERFERHVKMRLAFRFGVITVTDATQAVIRVRILLPDGRTSHGVAAEALAAQWVEKSPAFTDAQNLDQHRQASQRADLRAMRGRRGRRNGQRADVHIDIASPGWSTADVDRQGADARCELGRSVRGRPIAAHFGGGGHDRSFLEQQSRARKDRLPALTVN